MFKLNSTMFCVNNKRELTKFKNDKNGSLQVDMSKTQLDERDKANRDQQEKLYRTTNKKLSNEYILREGYEREWIERVKISMCRLTQKSFYEQLTELIP